MSKRFTVILVLMTALFWGANFNVGKLVVQHMSPLLAAVLRFSLASVLLVIIAMLTEKNIWQRIKDNWDLYIFLGLIGIAGFNGLFFYGLAFTEPVNGALIVATNPLVTLILAAIILQEPITINQRLGMLVSLIGVIIVITHGSWQALEHFKIAAGDWIIMGGNICWACYTVISRRYVKNSTPMITTTATMVIGTLFLILATDCAGIDWHNALGQSTPVYSALIFMAIPGSVLAYLFWNYGIKNLGASQTAVYFNFVPVFTVLISLVIGRPVSPLQIVGGAIVILGVLISSQISKFGKS